MLFGLSSWAIGVAPGTNAFQRTITRTATVTAVMPLRLLALDRATFVEGIAGHSRNRDSVEAVAGTRMQARG